MKKVNCWEFKKCGREPGGINESEFGACPAATETRTDGINDGGNAGRSCWPVSGTFCAGIAGGSFAAKVTDCLQCDFYKLVCQEQGGEFKGTAFILKQLQNSE